MKFRLVTSLLLAAVLATLYLWLGEPDAQSTDSAPAAAPSTDPGAPPGLGRIKIF
jgi:multidrug resistance efflux pump